MRQALLDGRGGSSPHSPPPRPLLRSGPPGRGRIPPSSLASTWQRRRTCSGAVWTGPGRHGSRDVCNAGPCGPTTERGRAWLRLNYVRLKKKAAKSKKKYNNKSHLYKLSHTVVESPRNKYQSILSRSYIDVTRSIQKLLDGDFAVS